MIFVEYTRIPEAEFEVMQIVWSQPPPISSTQVTGLQKKWKHQTVLTLLTRLTRRGYLASEKLGKDRFYTPAVSRDDYLSMETGYFMRKFHQNSLMGLMSALYLDSTPSDEELSKLEQWLRIQKEKESHE
jgi:predicted transcriptional regulator